MLPYDASEKRFGLIINIETNRPGAVYDTPRLVETFKRCGIDMPVEVAPSGVSSGDKIWTRQVPVYYT